MTVSDKDETTNEDATVPLAEQLGLAEDPATTGPRGRQGAEPQAGKADGPAAGQTAGQAGGQTNGQLGGQASVPRAGGQPVEATTAAPATSASADTAATTSATVSTDALPPAEPAWLANWGTRENERLTPRIRWASVVWGLIFAVAGWLTVWTLFDTARRGAFSDWVVGLSDGGWAIVGAVFLGGLLLVGGVIAGLRAATGGRR